MSLIFSKLQGNTTIKDDVADVLGGKVAYQAYQKFKADNQSELMMLSNQHNFTENKYFWLSMAQTWCHTIRSAKETVDVFQQTHSLHEYRVRGIISNIDAFADDFNCTANKPIEATERCRFCD